MASTSRHETMVSKSLAAFHILGAVNLWMLAAVNILVHPPTVRCSTISVLLITLGGWILIQELCRHLPRWLHKKSQTTYGHFCRALCFLVASASTFDRLTALPCDVQMRAPSHSTAPAKFSVPVPGAILNVTTVARPRSPSPRTQAPVQKSPPAFGTSIYLIRSLSPHCIKVDAVPGQTAGSVAWVNVSVNKKAQALVYAACASTLAFCIIYTLFGIFHSSSKGKVPSEASSRRQDSEIDLRPLESAEEGSNGPQRARKDTASVSSQCATELNGKGPIMSRKRADRYDENVLALSDPADSMVTHRNQSTSRNMRASSSWSLRQPLGSTRTSTSANPALNAFQGAASTPDQLYRGEKLELSPVSIRAASDMTPRTQHTVAALGVKTPVPSSATRGPDKFGYRLDYDCAVDFASGCIMHQPIFGQPERLKTPFVAPAVLFPTLRPPDFSRASLGSPVGLSPRKISRRSASSTRKLTQIDSAMQQPHDEMSDLAEAAAGPVLLKCTTADVIDADDVKASVFSDARAYQEQESLVSAADISSQEDLPPKNYSASSFERKAQEPTDQSKKRHDRPLKPTVVAPAIVTGLARPGTADSACSVVTNSSIHLCEQAHLSSRPGTGTSAKSGSSLTLMRRRRGLFAALDLHLGSRLSGISQDASVAGSTYESGSCSARTFGNGGQQESWPVAQAKPFHVSAPSMTGA